MFLSILLDGKELWLPAAVACSIIFLFALTVLSTWSRRKRAKLKEETSLVIGPYVEPPSEKAEIEVRKQRLSFQPINYKFAFS